MGKNRFEQNYDRLLRMLPQLADAKTGDHWRLKAPGLMDLVVEVIGEDEGTIRVSLAHYYEQNGDLMADPEMEVRVYRDARMVDALSFYMAAQGYRAVSYPEPGLVCPRAKQSNNAFLQTWLQNLKAQGHAIQEVAA